MKEEIKEELKKLITGKDECNNCGGSTFNIIKLEEKKDYHPKMLVIRCYNCNKLEFYNL